MKRWLQKLLILIGVITPTAWVCSVAAKRLGTPPMVSSTSTPSGADASSEDLLALHEQSLEEEFADANTSTSKCVVDPTHKLEEQIDATARDAGVVVSSRSVSCNCAFCRIELDFPSDQQRILINPLLVPPNGTLDKLIIDSTYIPADSTYPHARIFGRVITPGSSG